MSQELSRSDIRELIGKTFLGSADQYTFDILVGRYPQLTLKEFLVCNHIIWAIQDHGFNEGGEIILHILSEGKRTKQIFKDGEDIVVTINDLIAKGIIIPKQNTIKIGTENPRFETFQFLYLKDEVTNEILTELAN